MSSMSTAEFNATDAAVDAVTQELAEGAEPAGVMDEPEDITNLAEKADDQVLPSH